ncbi:MAG: hypothetical protein JEZ08_15415 [Clostridiales bacterium]|nr:hypothetical protein [Clostridiales bacterium]
MQRIIEQLGLVEADTKALIVSLTVENGIKSEIVKECEDHLQVRLLKEDIEDNKDSIEDAKLTLKEIDQAYEILSFSADISKK